MTSAALTAPHLADDDRDPVKHDAGELRATETSLVRVVVDAELDFNVSVVDTSRARSYAAEARAQNTRRSYATQERLFRAWCMERGVCPLPAASAVVASYIASLADRGLKWASIALALTALSQMHKLAGYASPRREACVSETWQGICRTIGRAQTAKAPLHGAELLEAVRTRPETLGGLRDRAILLLGFSGGFRRSELVGLDVPDLRRVPRGLEASIRRSKTDQQGIGRIVPVPRERIDNACPVRAVGAWLDASGIDDGPLFRPVDREGRVSPARLSGHHVARVVKAGAAAVGLDPALLSGHSLRAGLVTAARRAGRSDRAIMRTTGHRSSAMLDRYTRGEGVWDEVAGEDLVSRAALRPTT